jgi:three-Cys-motif partner protein
MSKDFHAEPFNEETKLKLEIFRGYIREWLPVFLAKPTFKIVALYDFFAGPGKDVKGEKGSPLIIIEELNRYLNDPSKPQSQDVKIKLYFNDEDTHKYMELKKAIENENVSKVFSIEVDNKDFTAAFKEKFSSIASADTATLVILDQCGIKHITQDVFTKLISCRATDILFFISSSTIRRFTGEDCIDQYFLGVSRKQIEAIDPGHIHRFICNQYYRKLIPADKNYYLAPFSIKKDANVYGLIFGSSSLYGLEKFLRVCWDIDPETGEANYNIDRDAFRNTQLLFKELSIPRKKDEFQNNLLAELTKKSLTNKELYKYCLENGFLPKHMNEILTAIQKEGKLITVPKDSKHFYIGWNYYSGKKDIIVTFSVKE